MESQIGKWGNSLAVRIPKALAVEAGMREGAKVELKLDQGRLVLTPMVREQSLEELVKAINSKNRHAEESWGAPQGNELW